MAKQSRHRTTRTGRSTTAVNQTIGELQKIVISELTWDFRVGDAYIQRILMLVETGAYDQVKPTWISNVLKAQNDDGSWDDLDPILYLGNDYVFTHTSTLPKIGKAKADFHTTAQAIWLLSLLLNEAEKNDSPGYFDTWFVLNRITAVPLTMLILVGHPVIYGCIGICYFVRHEN